MDQWEAITLVLKEVVIIRANIYTLKWLRGAAQLDGRLLSCILIHNKFCFIIAGSIAACWQFTSTKSIGKFNIQQISKSKTLTK